MRGTINFVLYFTQGVYRHLLRLCLDVLDALWLDHPPVLICVDGSRLGARKRQLSDRCAPRFRDWATSIKHSRRRNAPNVFPRGTSKMSSYRKRNTARLISGPRHMMAFFHAEQFSVTLQNVLSCKRQAEKAVFDY